MQIELECPPYGSKTVNATFGYEDPSDELGERLKKIRADWPALWPIVVSALKSRIPDVECESTERDIFSDDRTSYELAVVTPDEFCEENWSFESRWIHNGVTLTLQLSFYDNLFRGGQLIEG